MGNLDFLSDSDVEARASIATKPKRKAGANVTAWLIAGGIAGAVTLIAVIAVVVTASNGPGGAAGRSSETATTPEHRAARQWLDNHVAEGYRVAKWSRVRPNNSASQPRTYLYARCKLRSGALEEYVFEFSPEGSKGGTSKLAWAGVGNFPLEEE